MAARSDFFALPPVERERFAAHLPRADRAALERVLLEELFGITAATDDEVAGPIDALDPDQRNVVNATVPPLFGIGEDSSRPRRRVAPPTPAAFDGNLTGIRRTSRASSWWTRNYPVAAARLPFQCTAIP